MEAEQVKELIGNKKLKLHNCSLCQYPCGWLYINGKLHYDSGCDCVTYGPVIKPREETDIIDTINRNSWTEEDIISRLE